MTPDKSKTLSEDALRRLLITPDGQGCAVKEAALEELIERKTDEFYSEMREMIGE